MYHSTYILNLVEIRKTICGWMDEHGQTDIETNFIRWTQRSRLNKLTYLLIWCKQNEVWSCRNSHATEYQTAFVSEMVAHQVVEAKDTNLEDCVVGTQTKVHDRHDADKLQATNKHHRANTSVDLIFFFDQCQLTAFSFAWSTHPHRLLGSKRYHFIYIAEVRCQTNQQKLSRHGI